MARGPQRALVLSQPSWDELEGAVSEAAWIADKDRKVGLAAQYLKRIEAVSATLAGRNALFVCTPDMLRDCPESAQWYVSLAGYSMKTLKQLAFVSKNAGMTRSAAGLVESLSEGRTVTDDNLAALSRWITKEIDAVLPAKPSLREAQIRVAMILGGRIIGIGQNSEGNEAVSLVKRLFVQRLGSLGCEVQQQGSFVRFDATMDIHQFATLRFAKSLVFEFVGGGNRPDLKIVARGRVLMVAEVKGRKDLSNVWESWMPQVADHMRTWSTEYPGASRLLLGTIITREMIDGRSARGTSRTGLKGLYDDGLLDGALNVSKVVEGHARSVAAFNELAYAVAEFAE